MSYVRFILVLFFGILVFIPDSMAVLLQNSKSRQSQSDNRNNINKTRKLSTVDFSSVDLKSKNRLKNKISKVKRKAPEVPRNKAKYSRSDKKYWSVQCKDGFLKEGYVYCSRKNTKIGVKKTVRDRKLASLKSRQKVVPSVKR